jgi:hypothetical protein
LRCSDELPTDPFQSGLGPAKTLGPIIEGHLRHPQGVGLCHGRLVHGVSHLAQTSGTRDGHVHRRTPQRYECSVYGPPQLPMIGAVAPLGSDAGFNDVANMLPDHLTLIEDGSEGCAPLVSQTMPDIDGFLISRLATGSPSLEQRPDQTGSQRATDAQPSCPNGSISLIHAGHHAVGETHL